MKKKYKHFIENKTKVTANIDTVGKSQVLNQKSLVAFNTGMDIFEEDLNNIENQQRADFLRFNFTRLINASLALKNDENLTSVKSQHMGDEVKFYLKLGFKRVKEINTPVDSIFDKFDFFDLYKIGWSRVFLLQKSVKNIVAKYGSMQENQFWGPCLDVLVNSTFETDAELECFKSRNNFFVSDDFEKWSEHIEFVVQILPFAFRFFTTLNDLTDSNQISSHFYLNYSIEDIDFEVLLLSSLINFSLGNFEKENSKKLAVMEDELLDFWKAKFHIVDGKTKLDVSKADSAVDNYIETFGFSNISLMKNYLLLLMDEHLSGYDLQEIENDRRGFAHVGGPLVYENRTVN